MHRTNLGRPAAGFSRTNLKINASSFDLYEDGYQSKLQSARKNLGTSSVSLIWSSEKGKEDYLKMTKAFSRKSEAFENVSAVTLDAAHLPLDGRFVSELGLNKSLVKELRIKAWTFHSPDKMQWQDFKQLKEVYIDLSDGPYFPQCFNDLCRSLPSSLSYLRITNRGPHYARLDCPYQGNPLPLSSGDGEGWEKKGENA